MILTVSEILRWALDVLNAARVECPRADAEIILCHHLGLDRAALYAEPAKEVDEEAATRIKEAVTMRSSGMPVQYVVGQAQFLSQTLTVRRGVLIPRPETELLAVEAMDFLKTALSKPDPWGPLPAAAADVGTGSGAIAVALAAAIPGLHVYATDVSDDALEVAAENARRAGVEERITLLHGSMVEPLLEHGLEGKLAAVVSNPPYVSESQWRTLPLEVRDYEPKQALLAGPEGLDCIEMLIDGAPQVLAPGGLLAFEIGAWQWPKVLAMLDRAIELASFRVIKDLAGFERIATAVRTHA